LFYESGTMEIPIGAGIIQGSRRGVITTSYFIGYYYFILMKRFCERQKDLRAVHLSGAIDTPPGWMRL
jgi:hypothetical protein